MQCVCWNPTTCFVSSLWPSAWVGATVPEAIIHPAPRPWGLSQISISSFGTVSFCSKYIKLFVGACHWIKKSESSFFLPIQTEHSANSVRAMTNLLLFALFCIPLALAFLKFALVLLISLCSVRSTMIWSCTKIARIKMKMRYTCMTLYLCTCSSSATLVSMLWVLSRCLC